MKRITQLGGALTVAVLAVGVVGCASPAAEGGPVTLTYETLAWQTTAIQANKDIVEEWNEANPDIQVEYVQGDWGSIGDQLTTSFQGGKAPDLWHYYDTGIQPFAQQGFVLDLTDYLSDDFVADIRESAWPNVSFPGLDGIWGVPFLQEPGLILANKAILDEAGIAVPAADDPWTWDEWQDIAKQLTTADRFGAAMPLANSTGRILPLGPAFEARYFTEDRTALEWGDAEAEVPTRVHEMLHQDKSMSMDLLGLGPADLLPAFFEGTYATILVGSYMRQQVIEGAPDGFEWVAIPSLKGVTQAQSNGAQTISISEQTEHPEEATQFLEFLLNPENQARLALGDWVTPTSIAAADLLAEEDPALGWAATIESSKYLEQAGFQSVAGYDEWAATVADLAFADYFGGAITIDELAARLASEGDPILEKAASR